MLNSVRHLILDEADRMLDSEFLDQIEEIFAACSHPDIQKAVFSATLPANAEKVAFDVLRDPIRVVVGLKCDPDHRTSGRPVTHYPPQGYASTIDCSIADIRSRRFFQTTHTPHPPITTLQATCVGLHINSAQGFVSGRGVGDQWCSERRLPSCRYDEKGTGKCDRKDAAG